MKKAIIIIVALLCCFSSFSEEFKGVYIDAFGKSEQEIHKEMVGLGFSKTKRAYCSYEKPDATYGSKLISFISFSFEQDKCNLISVAYPKDFGVDNSEFFQILVDAVCKKYELIYSGSEKKSLEDFDDISFVYQNKNLYLTYTTFETYFYKQSFLFFDDKRPKQKAIENLKQKASDDI